MLERALFAHIEKVGNLNPWFKASKLLGSKNNSTVRIIPYPTVNRYSRILSSTVHITTKQKTFKQKTLLRTSAKRNLV